MLFSIIIPIYNVEAYLKECLDSILSQDFDDVELICVNDGSTDGSLAILKEYAADYSEKVCIFTQPNAGLSAARNKAMAEARGEYLLFLDSDDWLTACSLQKLAEIIKSESPDIIAFNSELYYESENRTVPNLSFNHLYDRVFEDGMGYFSYFVGLRNWGPSAVCFYVFKRDLLIKNKLQFEPGLLHEDELFMPQALYYGGQTRVVTDTVYCYRMRSGSIIHNQKQKNYTDNLKIAGILFDFFVVAGIRTKFVDRTIYNLILGGINGLMHTQEGRAVIPERSSQILVRVARSVKEKLIARLIQWDVRCYKYYVRIVKR